MPKVSIVIPIYNVEKYIRQALDSVINQTLTDIEIICIEDCSTDNCRNILKEYAQKDSRIKVILNEKNVGAAVSRNKGIDIATGEYLMFLDPDDWYELDACELAYNQISKNNNDFVLFSYYSYNDKSGKQSHETFQITPFLKVIGNPDIKLWEVTEPFITAVFVVMQIYNKNFVDRHNIRYDETLSLGEDALFYFNAIAKSTSFSVLKKPLYYYRKHEKSVTNKRNDLWKEHFESRLKSIEILANSEHPKEYLKSYLPYFISSMIHWYFTWTARSPKLKREIYDCIHDLFLKLRQEYGDEFIMTYMSPDKVKRFNEFANGDGKLPSPPSFFEKNFRIETKYNLFSTKLILTILGMKLSINKNKVEKILVKRNQKSVLEELKEKSGKSKLRVVFLSSEISKWNATSLYWALEKSELFEPLVLVFPLIRVHIGEDFSQPSLEEQYNFYKEKSMNVEYAYKDGVYLKLEDFSPDIIFYQQSWCLPAHYKVEHTSKFALPCYFSYGCQILDWKEDYSKDFNKLLFKYFVDSNLNIKRFESYNKKNSENCVSLGLPKFDAYLDNKSIPLEKYWKDPAKFKIIYAPHHSFEKDGLNFATFEENGKFILDLAKKHPETTWVFKPHPRLKFALLENNIMTESEIEEYYKAWEEIGNIYTSGDYFDIFKSSDLMITDCCSFLGEYLPSEKPLIRLKNPNAMKLNAFGEGLTKEYYVSHNNEELKCLFDEIAINKNDYKKSNRLKIANDLMIYKESSGEKICKYLEEIIRSISK